jgi:ABC-type spermidine/putrescine transport system permease subunit I
VCMLFPSAALARSMVTNSLMRLTDLRRAVAKPLRRRRSVALALVLGPPLLWMLGLYLLPLVFLFLYSFWQVVGFNVEALWTLDNYRQILADPVWLQILLRTVVMATLVTLTAIGLALPLAYFLVRYTSRWRNLLYLAVLVPLWSSYLVRVFAWKTILGSDGVLNTFLIDAHIIHQPVEAFLGSSALSMRQVQGALPTSESRRIRRRGGRADGAGQSWHGRTSASSAA